MFKYLSFTKGILKNSLKRRTNYNNFCDKIKFEKELQVLKKSDNSAISLFSKINEPEDFRTVYLENLPTDWSEVEIRVRLEQLGNIEKLLLIKNSIGEYTGKVLAVYSKIDNLVQAINNFKDKMPFFKPVKIRFYREFKTKKQLLSNDPKYKSDVLLIKNIPSDLPKEDLHLFLSEFKSPIHISYPRDEENEFKRIAYVYFLTKEDAEYVLKYANLRYVSNKQLFVSFSKNHWDITDFRTRAELGIKLPPEVEMKLYLKQINNYKALLENKGEYTKKDVEKIEYLTTRFRKIEYQLKDQKAITGDDISNHLKIEKENVKQIRGRRFSYNDDKSIIFVDKKNMFNK